MTTTFSIRPGKRGRLGSLTAAVEAESIDAASEREIAAQYIRHCAARGLVPEGEIHVETQVNWLTHGLDVTATAYVRTAGRKTRAVRRVRTRKAAAARGAPSRLCGTRKAAADRPLPPCPEFTLSHHSQPACS
jgi:hypothetical protein